MMRGIPVHAYPKPAWDVWEHDGKREWATRVLASSAERAAEIYAFRSIDKEVDEDDAVFVLIARTGDATTPPEAFRLTAEVEITHHVEAGHLHTCPCCGEQEVCWCSTPAGNFNGAVLACDACERKGLTPPEPPPPPNPNQLSLLGEGSS